MQSSTTLAVYATGQVFNNPELLNLISDFTLCLALDATCRALRDARARCVIYKIRHSASEKFFQNAEIRRSRKVWLTCTLSKDSQKTELMQTAAKLNLIVPNGSLELFSERSWSRLTTLTVDNLRYGFHFPVKLELDQLKKLTLRNTDLVDVVCLNTIPNLNELLLKSCSSVTCSRPVKTTDKLKSLQISHCQTVDLACFADFRSVTSLKVLNTKLSIKGGPYTQVSVFPSLKSLYAFPFIDLRIFRNCLSLTELSTPISNLRTLPLSVRLSKLIAIEDPPSQKQMMAHWSVSLTLNSLKELKYVMSANIDRRISEAAASSLRILDLTESPTAPLTCLRIFTKLETLKLQKLQIDDIPETKHCISLREIRVREAPCERTRRFSHLPIHLV